RRVPHVGALGRGLAVGDPEQAEQAHHVVEANTRCVPRRAANRVDEWRPLRVAQLPRVESRNAPVLTVSEELVGRRADAHARREVVTPSPRVETVRRETDGHVGYESDLA